MFFKGMTQPNCLNIMCRTPSKTQTNRQKMDRCQESNLVHFSSKMWQ